MTEKPQQWYEPFYTVSNKKFENEEDASKKLDDFSSQYVTKHNIAEFALALTITYPTVTKFKVTFAKYAIADLVKDRDVKALGFSSSRLFPELRYLTLSENVLDNFKVIRKVLDDGLAQQNDPELIEYKAKVEFIVSNFADCLQLLEIRATMDPEKIEPHLNKATVLEAQKEYEQALKFYEVLKFKFPKHKDPPLMQGKLYMKLFKFDEAIACFELALRLDCTLSPSVYAYIGQVHYLRKDFAQAKHFFEKSILENQEYPTVHLFQGDLYAFNSNWVEALFRYQKFADTVLIHRDVENRIRHAIDEKGGVKETTKIELFIQWVPSMTNFELERNLWQMVDYFRLGQYNPCLEFLKCVREIRPKNPEIRVFLAKIYIMLNDNETAISELSAGLANVNVDMPWQSHFSIPLNEYKQEMLQKKAILLKLLIEIASIEIDYNVVTLMHARNRLFDHAFSIYKNKLMLKYSYLPDDPNFNDLVAEARKKISEFKQDLADPSSSLYIPFNIQNNPALFLYYTTFIRQASALEEISQNQGLNLSKEAAGLHSVLKNIEPLIRLYGPTAKLKTGEVNLKSSNMNMLESNQAKRTAILKDLAQSFVGDNSQRITNASASKELTLFIKEGLIGKYYEYFSLGRRTHSTASSLEELARIDALKLLIILYNGMFDQTDGMIMQEKVSQIQQLMQIPFTTPKKSTSCLCFKF